MAPLKNKNATPQKSEKKLPSAVAPVVQADEVDDILQLIKKANEGVNNLVSPSPQPKKEVLLKKAPTPAAPVKTGNVIS